MYHWIRQNIQHAKTGDLALKHDITATRMIVAGLQIRALFCRYSFNPNQPRVPRGNSDGGQWADGSTSRQPGQRVAARRPRRGGTNNLTPAQQIARRLISVSKRKISQINPREEYLEPLGGSYSIGALRSFNRRLNSLERETTTISSKIANGHGFAKHEFVRSFRQTTDHTRFTNITTREQYAARIYDTIVNGTHSRALGKGRTVYYKVKTRMIVVVDPNSRDSGTAYPAFDGIRTYNAIKK